MTDPIWTNNIVDLYHGDCRDVLRNLPAKSVHCVVTSPPYWGLRDYDVGEMGIGLESTPEIYTEHLVEVFRQVWRVLRDDGTLWLNLGDSYYNYRPGYQAQTRQGLARHDGAVVKESGKRGMKQEGLKEKDLIGIPWRVAFALQADGWYLRSDIIWQKPNPMPESVADRPTKNHEYLFLLTKNQRYYYDADAIREAHKPESIKRYLTKESFGLPRVWTENGGLGIPVSGGKEVNWNFSEDGRNKRSVWTIPTQPHKGAHFATFPEKLVEPCILAGTSEKGVCAECGAPYMRVIEKGELKEHPDRMNRNVRNVADYDGNDYAVRESTLGMVRESNTVGWRPTCGHQGTTVPATVLDPFIGSGTTAIVAQRLGRRCIGIDASESYLKDIAVKRITGVTLPMQLDV